MTNKEKFLALVSKEETKTVERAKARLANKSYSQISNLIAFEILERLDELNWKQKDLAEKMDVSPQLVSKWVKGNENFTLETLMKLSEVLEIVLIEVPAQGNTKIAEGYHISSSAAYQKYPMPSKVNVATIPIQNKNNYENRFVAIAN